MTTMGKVVYFGRVPSPDGHHKLVNGEVSREEYLRQYPDSVLKDQTEHVFGMPRDEWDAYGLRGVEVVVSCPPLKTILDEQE